MKMQEQTNKNTIKCSRISKSTSLSASSILLPLFMCGPWIQTFPQNLNQRLGTKTRYTSFNPNTLMQLESDTAVCLKMN